MTRPRTWIERLRETFWVLPAAGVLLGLAMGLVLPSLEASIELPDLVSFSGDVATAQALLQAIVAAVISVAGISFSVIVVALVLASQQLSPRVLRSFQRNRLNQGALAVFLGTAVYAITVLSSVTESEAEPVPQFATTVAIVLTGVSLVLFVVFLHHVLRSLNASAVIRRIAAEGHEALESPYPSAAGGDARDDASAHDAARRLQDGRLPGDVRARRAGYLATVKATELIGAARRHDAFVEQRVAIGDFVVTGGVLARVWGAQDELDELERRVREAFVLNEERLVDSDIAFPVRQLADVALKGLSPSINDPTTSENAMDSLTDTLVRLGNTPRPSELRLDRDGTPRLRALSPSFDQLVTLGFDQVRRHAADRASFSVRLLELLAALRELGGARARESAELQRQAELIREQASRLESPADAELVAAAYERLHGSRDAARGHAYTA